MSEVTVLKTYRDPLTVCLPGALKIFRKFDLFTSLSKTHSLLIEHD